jgi:hypothetical protein
MINLLQFFLILMALITVGLLYECYNFSRLKKIEKKYLSCKCTQTDWDGECPESYSDSEYWQAQKKEPEPSVVYTLDLNSKSKTRLIETSIIPQEQLEITTDRKTLLTLVGRKNESFNF